MPSVLLLLSACSYFLPPELGRIERLAPKAFDQGLAGDLEGARDSGVAVFDRWGAYVRETLPENGRFRPSDAVLSGTESAVEALYEATAGDDPLAIARAANDVLTWMDDYDEIYGDQYPMQLRLDTAARAVAVDAVAGNFDGDGLGALDDAWDPVRTWLANFDEAEADEVAQAYGETLDAIELAVDAGDADAVVDALYDGLALTEVMRDVPWVKTHTSCVGDCD